MKGHSYQLKLLPHIRIHDVFHVDRLRKASKPLPGQVELEEEPIEIDGNPKWPVEEILDSRIYRGRLQYKVS